jgi:hypothetical protein
MVGACGRVHLERHARHAAPLQGAAAEAGKSRRQQHRARQKKPGVGDGEWRRCRGAVLNSSAAKRCAGRLQETLPRMLADKLGAAGMLHHHLSSDNTCHSLT